MIRSPAPLASPPDSRSPLYGSPPQWNSPPGSRCSPPDPGICLCVKSPITTERSGAIISDRERERYKALRRLRKEAAGAEGSLLPLKHEDVRLMLADRVHGPSQRLAVRGKFDLLGLRDLVLNLVGHFQSALVHPAR